MLLDLVAVGLVGVIVYNLFGAKIKEWVVKTTTRVTTNTITPIVDMTIKTESELIHSAVNAWLELRSLAGINKDPTAVAAMDTLKSYILTWTAPIVEEKK